MSLALAATIGDQAVNNVSALCGVGASFHMSPHRGSESAMDLTVVTKFDNAGIDATFKQHVPSVGIVVDAQGRIQPVGNDVGVIAGPNTAHVTLKKISELFAGTKTPPSFRNGPTDDYILFFALIELTLSPAG